MRALAALHDVAGEHGARVAEEGIAPRFAALMEQALRSGHAHVDQVRRADPPGRGLQRCAPEDPEAWGYQRRAGDLTPTGPLIGYLMHSIPGAVCLEPAAALAVARKVDQGNGRTLGADPRAIGAALAAAGMLARTELDGAEGRETIRIRPAGASGSQVGVWALKLSALGYDTSGEVEQIVSPDDPTGANGVPPFPEDVDPFSP